MAGTRMSATVAVQAEAEMSGAVVTLRNLPLTRIIEEIKRDVSRSGKSKEAAQAER